MPHLCSVIGHHLQLSVVKWPRPSLNSLRNFLINCSPVRVKKHSHNYQSIQSLLCISYPTLVYNVCLYKDVQCHDSTGTTRRKSRPLNSHGLTVRLTVLGLFSRSHGKVLISHCHSFNLTVTHGFSLPSCLFFLWALIYKILSTS